jgi:PIN domain nuclease of toxin-antitoxin system
LADDERFGSDAERLVIDPTNQLLVSAAVVWEVAIKRSLGKLEAPEGLASMLLRAGAQPLPVTLEHAETVETLPWHHRDPFDRLLVAQAVVEGATLVSGDAALRPYGVPVVW